MTVDILFGRINTEPYVEQIRTAADSERDALGFLPASAYSEFSYQNRMLVAVASDSRELAGYILYGGAMPQGRIFQTWVDPKFRAQGVGAQLLENLTKILEKNNYLSVKANVASDLGNANSFYGAAGFDVVKTQAGGKSRGRLINVRVKELATPSLLDLANGEETFSGLVMTAGGTARTSLYVLDLNVLFDVIKCRTRAADAARVMSAAFENDYRLAVTSELIAELQRNTPAGRPDPTLELAKALPRLAPPPNPWAAQMTATLAPHVFPDRAGGGRLTQQDRSDLLHLITAIHECAAGFVTSEKAILKAADYLRREHGIDVLSLDALIPEEEDFAPPNLVSQAGDEATIVRPITNADHDKITAFVRRNHGSDADCRAALSSGTQLMPRRRFVVLANEVVRAVTSWDAPTMSARVRDIHTFLDEADPFATHYAQHLLARTLADVGVHPPGIFEMQPTVGQSTLRKVAISCGFFSSGGHSPRSQKLRKISLGSPLIPENWAHFRDSIELRTGLKLPATAPKFTSTGQTIDLGGTDGRTISPNLIEVERLFSPTIIAIANRPAIIFPITQLYAEDLFRGSLQPTMLSDREAVWHPVRFYISSASTYSMVAEGCILVFYESGTGGGRSAAIAVARVAGRYKMQKKAAVQYAAQKGVLDPMNIQAIGLSPEVTVTEFDNLMLFKKPVTLKELRAIGCADGANFVTAKRLMSHHLHEIIRLGAPHA